MTLRFSQYKATGIRQYLQKRGAGLGRQFRKCFTGSLVWTALLLSAPAFSQVQTFYQIDLRAQKVAESLIELSKQTNVQLLFPAEIASKLKANPVNGRYTLQQALEIMLEGTGYVGGLTQKGVLMISLRESSTSKNNESKIGDNPMNMTKKKSLLGSIIAMLASGASVNTAVAQEEAGSLMLEEITVTARRVSEDLMKVPVAITVLSGGELERDHISSSTDLQFKSPSLTIQPSLQRNSTSYAMRGQGQSQFGAQPGVQPYLNEVPQTSGASQLYDLQSVQVLKGPQGTLFGRNTTGGAVLFTSKTPGEEFDGFLEVTGGNLDYRRYQGAVDVPLIEDMLFLRLAGNIEKREGFTRSLMTGAKLDGKDNDAGRATLLFTPNDQFTNQLTYDYAHSNSIGGSNILTGFYPGGYAPLLYPGYADVLALQKELGPRVAQQSIDGNSSSTNHLAINTTTFDVGSVTLKNIASYTRSKASSSYDLDGSPYQAVELINNLYPLTDSSQVTEEFQVQGDAFDGGLDYIVGAYYEKRESEGPAGTTAITFGGTPFAQYRSDPGLFSDRSRALFGQATIDLDDLVSGLKFTAGYRKTWDDRSRSSTPLNVVDPDNPVCRNPVPLDECTEDSKGKFSGDSWTLGLDWQLSPDTLVYLTSRRGYKGGGFNAFAGGDIDPLFKPEELTDIELGLKSNWAVGDVNGRLSLALFNGEYRDFQREVSFVVGSTLQSTTINAKDATIRGVELEASIFPTDNVELSGFWSYIDADYKDYVNPFTEEDLSDADFAQTPVNKMGATATYKLPVSDEYGELSAQAVVYRQSSMQLNDENLNNPFTEVDGYTLLNLNFTWESILSSQFDFSLFGRNVTDRTYVIGSGVMSRPIGLAAYIYGEPRTWGASLRYRFGK